MIVCSFSTPVADLKGKGRTAQNVLACLRRNPRVSCFDLSELKWLRDIVWMLEQAGRIKDDKQEPYPYVRYEVLVAAEEPRPRAEGER